jgi:hypothetical protein
MQLHLPIYDFHQSWMMPQIFIYRFQWFYRHQYFQVEYISDDKMIVKY